MAERQLFEKMGLRAVQKSLLVWLMIIPLAVLNGAAREYVMRPVMGGYALPVSGILLCALIVLLAWACVPRLGAKGGGQYALIGFVWAVLTVLFECLLGLAAGRAWAELAAAYDVASGNLWLLVVVCTGCAPWLTAKMRGVA